MILMHTDRNLWEHGFKPFDNGLKHQVTCISAGPPAGLNDYRRVTFFSCLQDGNALFHIIDVKGRNTIALFCGMIENLA